MFIDILKKLQIIWNRASAVEGLALVLRNAVKQYWAERTASPEHSVVRPKNILKYIQQDFESYTETDYGPHSQYKMTYAGFRQEYDSHVNIEPRSGSDKWARVLSDDDSYGFTKISNTMSLSTQYTLEFDVDIGTTSSVIVDVYHANSSGTPISILTSDTITSSSDTYSFNFSTGATYNKVFIRFRQSDNATRKIFYVDDIRLYITSTGVNNFNENLNSATISGVSKSCIKLQFDAWTPWSHSEVYNEENSSGNTRLNVVTFVSNHGNHRYFDGLTASKSYTINLDIEMGTASEVKVYLWDVNGSGAVSNERVILTASSTGNYSGTFTPLYNKVLVQVRRSSGSNSVYFYMDNFAIYETQIKDLVTSEAPHDFNRGKFWSEITKPML